MADSTAIVTGAGGNGCGRAIALRLSGEGYRVVVNDITSTGGRETVRLIEAAGGEAEFFPADVCDEDAVRGLVEFAGQTFGDLRLLVNNASAPFIPGDIMDHWARTVQTDFVGALYATRYAIEAMQGHNRGGSIVNVASISGLWHGRKYPATSAPAYDSAKVALIRLTTSLAGLAASHNIRVNCLAPGWIDTEGPREYWNSLTPEQRKDRGVPARLLSPIEIADAVLRISNDEALAGRVIAWWSDAEPQLIQFADRGFEEFARWKE